MTINDFKNILSEHIGHTAHFDGLKNPPTKLLTVEINKRDKNSLLITREDRYGYSYLYITESLLSDEKAFEEWIKKYVLKKCSCGI